MQPVLQNSVYTPGVRADGARWVLLAYRLPREPSTPRSALWRKLRRLGAGLVAADYRTLIADVQAARQELHGQRRRTLGRLRRELRRVKARDYFPPPERELAQQAVEGLAEVVEEPVA